MQWAQMQSINTLRRELTEAMESQWVFHGTPKHLNSIEFTSNQMEVRRIEKELAELARMIERRLSEKDSVIFGD